MVGYEKKECLILICSVIGSFYNGSAFKFYLHNSEKNGIKGSSERVHG